MTISRGKILSCPMGRNLDIKNTTTIIIPPNTNPSYYSSDGSRLTWFGFLEDTTISAIEMYNTN